MNNQGLGQNEQETRNFKAEEIACAKAQRNENGKKKKEKLRCVLEKLQEI